MLGQTKPAWRVFPPMPAQEECSICQGTGWELIPSGGSAAARRCPCVALSRSARLKDRLHIPERFRHCTLENYHPGTFAQTRGLAEAWRFVECFPNVDRGMIFVGAAGSGKTHLAVGILMELAGRFQEDSLFADFRALPGPQWSPCGTAAPGHSAGSRLSTIPLLVLDDFGAATANDNQYRAALNLLHARMRVRRPTLCTGRGPVSVDAPPNDRRQRPARIDGASRCVIGQVQAFILGGFKIVLLGDDDARSRK